MASQNGTINPTATNGPSDVEHVHKNLERLTDIARANVRVARATANIAHAGEYRWRLPAGSALPKEDSSFETGFDPRRRIDSDGSRSGLLSRSGRNTSMIDARPESRHGTGPMGDAGGRWERQILDLSRAVKALSGAERSSAGRAISDGRKHAAAPLRWNAEPTGRARGRESLEGRRRAFGMPGLPANVHFAPVIRGINPPANISRREFARPTSGGRVSNDGGGRASITVNSTPTVVINGQAGAATQHDLIGALRAHREELFDQLKRESARRERAQF